MTLKLSLLYLATCLFLFLLLLLTVLGLQARWVTFYYLGMSLLTLLLFWRDKWLAVRGRRRIPESTLLASSLAGGWPGGVLGQHWLRHKTQKPPFTMIHWLSLLLHVALLVSWEWFWLQH